MDEVSITIGITPCSGGPTTCAGSPSLGPGTVLFNGPFNDAEDPNNIGAGLHEDFNVTIPSDAVKGTTALTVFHVAFTQASPWAIRTERALTRCTLDAWRAVESDLRLH